MKKENVLVLGFGNPGRGDDGLGPAFAEAIEKLSLDGVETDANYQLVLEDAEAASRYDIVVFADADIKCQNAFFMHELAPQPKETAPAFSTHSISPAEVITVARELFNASCRAFILGIRGYNFDQFNESLTEEAEANLKKALAFFEPVVRERNVPGTTQGKKNQNNYAQTD